MENTKKYVYSKKKQSTGSKFLAAIGLKHLAMDADPEEVAELMDEVSEEYSKEKARDNEEAAKNEEVVDESPEFTALNDKVDKLVSVVEALVARDEEADPEDAIDNIIEKIEDSENGEAEVVEDEEIPDGEVSDPDSRPVNPIPNADALVDMLKAIKPVIANMKDKKEKKATIDSITKALNRSKKQAKGTKDGYKAIADAQRKQSLDNAPKAKVQDFESMGDEIAKRFNANMKGDK